MKCFYHQKKDAVGTCQNCGKGLCKECAGKYTPCLCDDCAVNIKLIEENEKEQKRKDALIDTTSEFIAAIIKGSIAVLIWYLIVNKAMDTPFDVSQLFIFFLPFGWALFTYLEQYLPPIFLSGVFLWIYLALKFVVSILLGVPCFIYQVIKFIIKLITNRKSN